MALGKYSSIRQQKNILLSIRVYRTIKSEQCIQKQCDKNMFKNNLIKFVFVKFNVINTFAFKFYTLLEHNNN